MYILVYLASVVITGSASVMRRRSTIVFVRASKFIVMWTRSFVPHHLSLMSLHVLCLSVSQETLAGVGSLWGEANDLEVTLSPLRLGAGG